MLFAFQQMFLKRPTLGFSLTLFLYRFFSGSLSSKVSPSLLQLFLILLYVDLIQVGFALVDYEALCSIAVE